MQYNPYIWLTCLIIIAQLIYYTWLDNSKQYQLRSKLTKLTFCYGWIINVMITITVFWSLLTYSAINHLETGMQVILGIGTSVCWIFWFMCKDSAPYYKK